MKIARRFNAGKIRDRISSAGTAESKRRSIFLYCSQFNFQNLNRPRGREKVRQCWRAKDNELVIKRFYDLCLAAGSTRRLVRSARGRLYRSLGVPEAFNDIARLAQATSPTLFLDIGCFQGNTVQRFRESGITCPIVGFDPLPENIEIATKKNQGHQDIRWMTMAVSDVAGEGNFFVNANVQTSSLLENDEGNVRFLSADTKHERRIAVKMTTLDDWQGTSGLDAARTIIKCDVQGAEFRVIQGGRRLFADRVVGFYAEVQLRRMYQGQPGFEELNKVLEGDFDLVLHNIYHCLHDQEGRALQTDALWVKRQFLGKLQS
jgi:FkbM family methyltransferase